MRSHARSLCRALRTAPRAGGRTSGSPLEGSDVRPAPQPPSPRGSPRSPRSVRRARRAPCRRHRHPLSRPSRCWIPGSGGRGPTSTEVRSRWEGTFTFRCAPRGRPHTRPTRRPCAETGPAEPGARWPGSAGPEAGRSLAPSAPAPSDPCHEAAGSCRPPSRLRLPIVVGPRGMGAPPISGAPSPGVNHPG